MINIPIHWFLILLALLIFFIGLSIFWFKQHEEKDKQAGRYEEYYFEKKKECDELFRKANHLALVLTDQLIDDITSILIENHEQKESNEKKVKILTKDDEYIINTKITKTKSYVFWSGEDDK